MTGHTTYTAGNFLSYLVGKGTPPTLATVYLALFTAVGTDAGTGFTEASFTNYARVSCTGSDFASPTAAIPNTITTVNAKNFPTVGATAGSAIVAWGLYDASTGGNLLEWDYIWAGGSSGQGAYVPFTASAASPSVHTSPAHGFSTGDQVVVTAEYGGTLPTLSAGSYSGLLTVTVVTVDTFTLTTSGSVALNASATGCGTLRKVVPQSVVSNVQIGFPAGSIIMVDA